MAPESPETTVVRARPGGSPPDPLAERDLLRFTTAGSVDDGKSTLIGRLLYDTKSILQDQLEAIQQASMARGEETVNLALLTDGLRAEREQNITIDVAYRYFATARRQFIIADTPGHVQYTRNMVTGASLADLAVVLVDARKGVQIQSRRHAYIAALLRIPHLVVAINKMDLVGFAEPVFASIRDEFESFARRIGAPAPVFIPISALAGDNVVDPSERMPWYDGPTLLEYLETVDPEAPFEEAPFRFPVQYVIRPHQDFRGFAGRIASGRVRPGEAVRILPGGRVSRVRSVEDAGGPLGSAGAGDSVLLRLEDEIDVSRGDLIVTDREPPTTASEIDAVVCWMSDQALEPGLTYLMMNATRRLPARVDAIVHRIDIDTLERRPADTLALNDIARVRFRTGQPLHIDSYEQNRITGSFILIHPHTHATVAAGMFEAPSPGSEPSVSDGRPGRSASPNVVWQEPDVGRFEREQRNGHAAAVVWLTGLSGAGKSTVARVVERRLFDAGAQVVLLDGDGLRHGLCGDLGFSEDDRRENLRRVGEVARLFFEAGFVVLAAFVSPYASDRARVRSLVPAGRFFEVHVDADLETCRARDPKGLYARALSGEIRDFTGIDAPYEAPLTPELHLRTDREPLEATVAQILDALHRAGILEPGVRPDAASNGSHHG